jgi:ribosomal 30S subunit maturation factor RimM
VELATRPPSIAIARIVRAHGIHGEVLAELHTDFRPRFDELEKVCLEFADGRRERFRLGDCWNISSEMKWLKRLT